MISTDFSKMQIYLKPGFTDMRKSINTLSIVVENEMKLDPFLNNLFLFCNKKRNIMKILYWDNNGFCLWEKKLEKDKFQWPELKEEVLKMTWERLEWLLKGIDLGRSHKSLSYSSVI